MSTELQTIQTTLPTLQELFSDNIEVAGKVESLNAILNTSPPDKWIKQHPYIKEHYYLPIDKVEYLLRKIFKRYKIRITGQGTAFNGVWVTVRVKYMDPVTNTWNYQDGIGSIELQVAKGESPADLSKINRGAISMAFPIAKTLAIKDACELIGNIFGANINRRDALPFQPDMGLIEAGKQSKENDRLRSFIEGASTVEGLEALRPHVKTAELTELFEARLRSFLTVDVA